MKITVLDKISFTVGDIDLTSLDNLGEVSYFDVLSPEEIKKVCKDSEVIVCNKTLFTKDILESLPKLKFIAITATGYNNVDLEYAKQKGILVANVPNYSTVDVAQHVFAFILDYSNKVSEYDLSVKKGDWIKSKTFCYFDKPLTELCGKTLGIYGFGNIGKTVAKIADAFGMKVIVYNRSKKDMPYRQVDKETIFKESDFLSIHCPLNDDTKHLISKNTLSMMKPSAVLINTSRGGVINEEDLKDSLNGGVIAHAYLDVLTFEPMIEGNVLLGAKNVTFTPHIAWAPKETRQRLIDLVANNITCFVNGKPINIVN